MEPMFNKRLARYNRALDMMRKDVPILIRKPVEPEKPKEVKKELTELDKELLARAEARQERRKERNLKWNVE